MLIARRWPVLLVIASVVVGPVSLAEPKGADPASSKTPPSSEPADPPAPTGPGPHKRAEDTKKPSFDSPGAATRVPESKRSPSRVENPDAAVGGAAKEPGAVPRTRLPEQTGPRGRTPPPEMPRPGIPTRPSAPRPELGRRECGPGVWPLLLELRAEPSEIWPGDRLTLRWRTVGAGNTLWRDPVFLTGPTGLRERVPAISTRSLAASELRGPTNDFVLETTCKREVARVVVVPSPRIASISPSPYDCPAGAEGADCPATIELRGSHFAPTRLPASSVEIWQDPSFRFALRARSWSDGLIVAEMPAQPAPATWMVRVTKGPDRTRLHASEPRPLVIRHTTEAGVVRPAPGAAYRGPRPAPRGGGSSGGGDATCSEGAACSVQPRGCTARGPDWTVQGVTRCRSGEAVCEAVSGEHYCSVCGGSCGGCPGHACSASSLCAPGGICRTVHEPGGSVTRCARIGDTSVPTREPCALVPGFCWTPGEVGDDEVTDAICFERR